jgi:hypothetical protein
MFARPAIARSICGFVHLIFRIGSYVGSLPAGETNTGEYMRDDPAIDSGLTQLEGTPPGSVLTVAK